MQEKKNHQIINLNNCRFFFLRQSKHLIVFDFIIANQTKNNCLVLTIRKVKFE